MTRIVINNTNNNTAAASCALWGSLLSSDMWFLFWHSRRRTTSRDVRTPLRQKEELRGRAPHLKTLTRCNQVKLYHNSCQSEVLMVWKVTNASIWSISLRSPSLHHTTPQNDFSCHEHHVSCCSKQDHMNDPLQVYMWRNAAKVHMFLVVTLVDTPCQAVSQMNLCCFAVYAVAFM